MREIGKDGSDKSKGLFSPEDWSCKSCGNINWARRSTCNVCNTARLNTLGQRTGYGGGFMERDEVVEYRRRGDSDDEFDEFGRKKKKFRKTSDGVNGGATEVSTPTSSRTDSRPESRTERVSTRQDVEDKDEDEEEEESGDDADLSKYDIWGAEDDDVDKATEEGKQSGNGSEAVKVTGEDTTGKSPVSSHSASDSESDSDASSSSGSSSSSSGSAGHGSRSSSASSSHSAHSTGRTNRAKTNERRTNPRDGGHERSRFETPAVTWVLPSPTPAHTQPYSSIHPFFCIPSV